MIKDGGIFAGGDIRSVLTSENLSSVYGVEVVINCINSISYIIPIEPSN